LVISPSSNSLLRWTRVVWSIRPAIVMYTHTHTVYSIILPSGSDDAHSVIFDLCLILYRRPAPSPSYSRDIPNSFFFLFWVVVVKSPPPAFLIGQRRRPKG
jgi:hypothetical protein